MFIALLPFISGCASIVSKSSWPYYMETDPPGATVSVENKKGKEIFRGRTPAVVKLRSGAGFFKKESYIISYSKSGFKEKKINVECKLNGWYFGNILLGGAIGMLIVDPATGAMFKLNDEGSHETLDPVTSTISSLKIVDIHQIPKDWQEKLVALN